MKTEKLVVFDESGNPKELRYYEDDKLSARLGVILDKDSNFIGLRELSIEEVSPPSWLERLRFKKPKPTPVYIHTIDFIGLINWINTIKTIKTIETIDLVKEITKIGNVEHATIDEITTIRDVTYTPSTYILNSAFLQGLTGWMRTGTVQVLEDPNYHYKYARFTANVEGHLRQEFPISLGTDWSKRFFCDVRSPNTGVDIVEIWFYYTDGTSSHEHLQVTVANAFQTKVLSPTPGKYITILHIQHTAVYPQCDITSFRMDV